MGSYESRGVGKKYIGFAELLLCVISEKKKGEEIREWQQINVGKNDCPERIPEPLLRENHIYFYFFFIEKEIVDYPMESSNEVGILQTHLSFDKEF